MPTETKCRQSLGSRPGSSMGMKKATSALRYIQVPAPARLNLSLALAQGRLRNPLEMTQSLAVAQGMRKSRSSSAVMQRKSGAVMGIGRPPSAPAALQVGAV